MFHKFLQVLSLRCRHRHTSKPFAAASSASSRNSDWEPIGKSGHYVVCLDCGQKFDYDWNTMQVVRRAG
ncbi:MAG: hypothetical protein JOZ10_04955 [Acidobacteria bacterium]|nr:hypothetical protein [Acidobacteriota bacterium]MBV9145527.1 hypothetical protein [Acidobacteriota bacterium]MBV9436921.1 hypothetical protein [Acidobacteriota bacterium]